MGSTFHFFFFFFRFELALCTFLAKVALCKAEHSEQGSCSSETGTESHSDSPQARGKNLVDSCTNKRLECELGRVSLKDDIEGHNAAHNLLVELADCVVDCQTGASNSSQQVQEAAYSQLNMEPRYPCNMDGPSSLSPSLADIDGSRASCSYVEMSTSVRASGLGATGMAMEGPSEEGSCYHLNNNNWLARDQSRHCSSMNSSCNGLMMNDWGRCGMPPPSWGGRVVGKRQLKGYAKGNFGVRGEEYDAFVNIFEGGSLLYCNMSFEALLNVRKQLEELGFPCQAVNDGLWLQV